MKWTLEILNETPSTQDAIKSRLNTGAEEGLVIQTLRQTGGRGRHGRQWISQDGNLFLSILLKPNINPAQLGIVIGAALAETIKSFLNPSTTIHLKWPNDVLIEGKKCAGILVEMESKAAIVGIGVNIVSAPPEIGAFLNEYAPATVNIDDFRTNLLTNIGKYYDLWTVRGFAPIRTIWMQYAPPMGNLMSVKIGNVIHEGRFDGIDENGNLMMNQNGKNIKISSGEVFF